MDYAFYQSQGVGENALNAWQIGIATIAEHPSARKGNDQEKRNIAGPNGSDIQLEVSVQLSLQITCRRGMCFDSALMD